MIRIYSKNSRGEAVYVNGVLDLQDDMIRTDNLIKIVNENLGIPVESVFMNEAQEDKVDKKGFPQKEATLIRWANGLGNSR